MSKIVLKVAYFTATFPYFIITAMVIRGCTLEGGTDGLKFYLQPDYAKLGDFQVCLFSISIKNILLFVNIGNFIAGLEKCCNSNLLFVGSLSWRTDCSFVLQPIS